MRKTALTLTVIALVIAMGLVRGTAYSDRPLLDQATAEGTVLENQIYRSQALGEVREYTIYLPPGYETSQQRYPVIYFLHGYGGEDTDWISLGNLNDILDRLIAARHIPHLIVVMPDGDNSWWVNNFTNTQRYADMVIEDLIPFIDGTYRTIPVRGSRAIAGLSMGGYGALSLAMQHPDLFVAAVSLSGAFFVKPNKLIYNLALFSTFGPYEKGWTWNKNNPLYLAKAMPRRELTTLAIYLIAGDGDQYRVEDDAAALHKALRDRGIPHEYRVYDGIHDWSFWGKYVSEALCFITAALTKPLQQDAPHSLEGA